MSKSALDELFVKEDVTVSHEVLRDMLVENIQMTSEGKIFFKPAFNKLTNKRKLLVVLLAKKALKLRMEMEELTSPKEIIEITGLPRGTVHPELKSLAQRRLVLSKDGLYYIPNFAIFNVKEFLVSKGD